MPPSVAGVDVDSWTCEDDFAPSVILLTATRNGVCVRPSLRTSCASLEYLPVWTRARASLWSRIYRSSPAGKEGARGTAMALEAKHVRRVTVYSQFDALDVTLPLTSTHLHNRSYSPPEKRCAPQRLCSHPCPSLSTTALSAMQHLPADCHS